MELNLQPLNLPSDNDRPFVIAGPCSTDKAGWIRGERRGGSWLAEAGEGRNRHVYHH